MMAGGASLAPRRWSLPALATEMRSRSWYSSTRLDHGREKQQELQRCRAGVLPGSSRLIARVGGQGPVVVLARAVDALKGLLVQQAGKAVAVRPPSSCISMVSWLWSMAMLAVVNTGASSCWAGATSLCLVLAEMPSFHSSSSSSFMKGFHRWAYGAEVVVLQLLALGGAAPKQGAAGEHEVRPFGVQLFRSMRKYSCSGPTVVADALSRLLAKQLQARARAWRLTASMERSRGVFLSSASPRVGAEGRGDAQGVVLDEGVGGGVPRGVAPGLKGGAQPAGGEAGGVRLALDQLFAGKVHDAPVPSPAGERKASCFSAVMPVMGWNQWVKWVAPLRDGPVLHGVGHHVGHGGVQRTALADGGAQRAVYVFGQPVSHDAFAEHHAAEQLGNSAHVQNLFSVLQIDSVLQIGARRALTPLPRRPAAPCAENPAKRPARPGRFFPGETGSPARGRFARPRTRAARRMRCRPGGRPPARALPRSCAQNSTARPGLGPQGACRKNLCARPRAAARTSRMFGTGWGAPPSACAGRRCTRPGTRPSPACAPPSLLSSNSICMPRQMPKSGVPARAFSTSGAARPLSHSAAMPPAKAPTPGSTSAPARRTCSGVWASCGCAPRAASARHTLSRLLRP